MNVIHQRHNPLDSRQLNAFVTLAGTGSLADTARELSLTNSAISHSIRALENDLGCRLLNRLGKKMSLTAAGETFLHHAQDGLKSFALARQSVQEFKKWGFQRLRIGAGDDLFQSVLPLVLARLKAQHPNLLLTAKVVQPSEIAARLNSGELDIILGVSADFEPEIEFTPLFEAPLGVVVGAAHRWAKNGTVPAGELAKEPCVMPGKHHPTRQLIARYFAASGIVFNIVFEIESLEVVKELLRHNLGVGILPDWAISDELNAGVLTRFPPGRKRLSQSWGLMRLRGRPLTAIENSFQILCAAHGKSVRSAVEGK